MMTTRVTLTLDKDMHTFLKRESAATSQTMGKILSDLVRKGLMATPEGQGALNSAHQQLTAQEETTARDVGASVDD